ncbi:SIR2 family NAD-dependent protein deacylase [Nakamurella multipartita]|uniref:Uncharacterized protein n=1 Tax=Nakamurella multipartita (strain ATCC 700099 / DSM 44233 / CIP 104796 / JCM 9543 / NBRC 105858 / Y-104) TaxID=479431 RepID=C8X684_NAKMY|nr:SIR2 family protein [Nakamurella multipartita]ACV76855.1 hypothetical protein Namu_0435 [Nakamurella multipartita DSM 44233]
MDASLPSWDQLILNLASENLGDNERRVFLTLNYDGLERRAETILHLSKKARPAKQFDELIRDSLLKDPDELAPGELAEGIARLSQAYPRRTSILTTNYDWILELAIEGLGIKASDSHSFDSWDEWEHLNDADHRSNVMHVHGMLSRPSVGKREPLVLSENDFLMHGPEIRTRLLDSLRGKLVVMLGVSLTDSNLLAPLHQLNGADGERYVVIVPPLCHNNLTQLECAEYAVAHSESLAKYLNVRPIILKSFGQVAQLISDLGLAAREPALYRRPSGSLRVSQSLMYGTRFTAALKDAYTSVGASARSGNMRDWDAVGLSNFMHELANSRGGPVKFLDKIRLHHRGKCDVSENLGVFLWLRDLPNRPESIYGLRLIASSAYAHWKSWSSFRVEPIRSDSRHAAVQAVFFNHAQGVNIDPDSHSGAWKGAFAIPLSIYDYRSTATVRGWSLDRLTIGALAVNSDHFVDASSLDSPNPNQLSALSVLTQRELEGFAASLYKMAERIFGD